MKCDITIDPADIQLEGKGILRITLCTGLWQPKRDEPISQKMKTTTIYPIWNIIWVAL